MIINFTPIVTYREEEDYYLYHTDNDILYVTKGYITEEFNFTDFPNGVAQDIVSDHFETSPVIEAKRVDGILYVTVERTLPETISEELAFPEPVDTKDFNLDTIEDDPLYIELSKEKEEEPPEEPTEPEYPQDEEQPDEPTEPEEEELGEPEVIKLTEHEYSKEENIDYSPIVDEVIVEPELEPVPEIEVPEPIEPDDDLLKTPEFTDIESALEQAFLEEEERKLQEELARQRELEEKLLEEYMDELESGEGGADNDENKPLEYPLVVIPTTDDSSEEEPIEEEPIEEEPIEEEPIEEEPIEEEPIEEEPIEPQHNDESLPSEDLEEEREYDYTSDEEIALVDITDTNIDTGSEVDNNG